MIRTLALLICGSALAATTATIGVLNVGDVGTGGGGGWTPPAWVPDNFGSGATAFSIEFVEIDDPGNPDRDIYGTPGGAVDYTFWMSKFAQTEDQVNKARLAGTLPITVSNIGTNKPATRLDQKEPLHFVNWLNQQAGYHVAYYFTPDGIWTNWPSSDDWFSPEHPTRHKDCLYFLPSEDERHKAAMWDKAAQVWRDWGQGTDGTNYPVKVNGWFLNGSTEPGTAVYGQRFDDRYPEYDSPPNTNTVTVTVDGSGGVTNIEFLAYISGHVYQQDTVTNYLVVQGTVTNAAARIATYQTISNVPGTFTNYVRGSGYSDGPATLTLDGYTVTADLITRGGEVYGAIPTGGRFNTRDYSTMLDIVQAGGSGAQCRVLRYSDLTYGAPMVALTWTIHEAGSGYTNGPALFSANSNSPHLTVDPVLGVSLYSINLGSADVDRAGGPSPFGVVGLFGNTSTMTDALHSDGRSPYFGGWWYRGRTDAMIEQWKAGGSERWLVETPTEGAFANGFRVCRKPLP